MPLSKVGFAKLSKLVRSLEERVSKLEKKGPQKKRPKDEDEDEPEDEEEDEDEGEDEDEDEDW